MLVSPTDIVTIVKLLHFLKAELPMLVTLLGMVILSSLLHPENADAPMFVTLFGIVTLVRLLQFWKAELPMFVTPSGITRDVTSSLLICNFFSQLFHPHKLSEPQFIKLANPSILHHPATSPL